MNTILANISAFEYWRAVGTPDIPTPKPSASGVSPSNTPSSKTLWPSLLKRVVMQGIVSYPIHMTSTCRPTRTIDRDVAFHFLGKEVPRKSFYSIDGDLGVVSPELCLIQIANVFSLVELIGIMHEFCGYYSPVSPADGGMIVRSPLTTPERLSRAAKRFAGFRGIKAFSRAIQYVRGPSRSPMETALCLCMSLPYSLGGYSLSNIELNSKVAVEASSDRRQRTLVLEPDLLFRKEMVCVEYDGKAFHEGVDAVKRDVLRVNALVESGYDVVTLTASQVASIYQMHDVAVSVARMIGKRMRCGESEGFARNRYDLRKRVLGSQSILRNSFADSCYGNARLRVVTRA